jgi:hypothetical protein
LSESKSASLDHERKRLMLDVDEMHDLLLHTAHEGGYRSELWPLYHTLLMQIERVLPLSTAVDDRLSEMHRQGALRSRSRQSF